MGAETTALQMKVQAGLERAGMASQEPLSSSERPLALARIKALFPAIMDHSDTSLRSILTGAGGFFIKQFFKVSEESSKRPTAINPF